jgi:hypothetical protein
METGRKPFLPPRWFIRAAWVVHRALYSMSGGLPQIDLWD